MRAAYHFAQRTLLHIHCQPEIGQNHSSFWIDHHIRGLDIAVDDTALVGVVQRTSHSCANPQHLFVGHELLPSSISPHDSTEVFALDIFHHKVVQAILIICIEYLHDI